MKSLLYLIAELKKIDPDKAENVANFEKLLADIFALQNPDSIVPLLGLFRDNALYDELMFSILHGIEIFNDQIYVSEILRGVSSLCMQSPRWASIIFMRILNSETTRLELLRQLRSAKPEIKNLVKSLMEKINSKNAKFLPKTTAILVAASNNNSTLEKQDGN